MNCRSIRQARGCSGLPGSRASPTISNWRSTPLASQEFLEFARYEAAGKRWDRMRGQPRITRHCIARSSGIEGDTGPGVTTRYRYRRKLSIPRLPFVEASSGAAEHSYANPSASCHARSEGAAVWGSFLRHQVCACEGVPGVLVAAVWGYPHNLVFGGGSTHKIV